MFSFNSVVFTRSAIPRFASRLSRHGGLLLLAAFVLLGVWVLDDYGMSWDEHTQRALAVETIEHVLGDSDAPRNDFNKFYGMVFEVPLVLLERALGLKDTRDVHLTRHIVTHLSFLVGGFFCYLLAHRLFGNRLLAAMAMIMFLLHPRMYAHSFFNTKDVPFLSMFMICLYLTHRVFGNQGAWRFLLLGVAVGVLINLRIMGLTLFAAVLAMQMLDLLQASDGKQRKRILGYMGVFALTCTATLYAASPYLWSDPLSGFVEWFATFSQHPQNIHQLFRGEWFRSGWVHPPEYVTVWLSITTSPVVLAMGILGTLSMLRGGATRLGDVFRNTRLRFGFMLVGCFVLPIVVIIILSANVYNGWRQMYFLYAPFCLLAVFGVQWMMSCVKSTRLKPGMYGAVGAGIAASVVSMALIHPHQHLYFNFLVDRTTPDHPRSQYDMDYWPTLLYETLEFLLERHPSSDISVRVPNHDMGHLNWQLLPASDRARVSVNDGIGDFLVTNYRGSWTVGGVYGDVPSSSIYDLNIYGSTVLSVTDLSVVDDEVVNEYRDIHSRTTSHGDPLIRAEFDVHLDGDELVYVKEDCSADDVEYEFFLHMDYPSGADADSPEKSNLLRDARHYFDFFQHGIMLDGRCVAVVPTPGSTFSRIWTGQFDPKKRSRSIWRGAYTATAPGKLEAFKEFMQSNDAQPAIRSVFDVYADDRTLVYAKEQCSTEDRDTRFFMHVHPADADDLPEEQKESGYDIMVFNLWEHGGEAEGGRCFAVVELPAYEITSISTGQYTTDRRVWNEEYNLATADAASTARELRHRGAQPAIQSVFSVYVDERTLVYAKEQCNTGERDTRFFLHVRPADAADLPEEREESGFENLDFNLSEHGGAADGGCFAVVELPAYEITSISTGQYTTDGQLWSEEYNLATADAASTARELRHRGAQPAIQSVFSVYVDERTLVYAKEQCNTGERDTRFFLHVRPADAADLPEERIESGYDNLDFNLREHGGESDGGCFAVVELPAYQIKSISTGQYTTDGQLWSEELETMGE